MSTNKYFLCKTSDITDPGSKGFEIKQKRSILPIFVVHKNGCFYAYYNHCPHTGVNLEWNEDQFLDVDKELIQCATHDALFNIESGECLAGPCNGEYLQKATIEVEDDEIHLIGHFT